MISLLAGAFSWLTGNSKSADRAMDAVDALVFTDEEKANIDVATRDKVLNFKIEYAKATQNQSISRRVISICVTALWALFLLLAVGLQLFGNSENADFVFKTINENINAPFMIIVGFYFASHVVGKLK